MLPLLANLAVLLFVKPATAVPQGSANILNAFVPAPPVDPPRAIPQNASLNALKYQPVLDYGSNSCYNVPAIDEEGNACAGLPSAYTTHTSNCREVRDLDNQNVYARARCNHGWCAYMYEHYFEKDIGLEHVGGVGCGHRHEWENVVVFVKDGEDMPSFVAASAHNGYKTKKAKKVRFQDTHAKIVYDKPLVGTHAMRFAKEKDEELRNARHAWIQGALVDWDGFPSTLLREKMLVAFVKSGIRPKIDDALFGTHLKKAAKHKIPEFDPHSDY